jgi:eukaryotic-like serine/threonine-protein kinase
MTIASGYRLGPYEIRHSLGAGGMGEVYSAKDTRLDRTVAIKVLPSHLSANPERRQRFEREARAVSALNHPNICTLHDVGHQDGIDFLVMEYIEGETLTSRLMKGPVPFPELLQYSKQIADALDKAHKHGIIHRDLKPGNIMLTKSGLKLLDFGLAKIRTEESSAPDVSALPTEQKHLTQEGTIIGTIQYMAPEQLEGKVVDERTDIFAFGTTLYEMATGKKAFEGTSQASVIAAILKDDPRPVSEIQPMLPPLFQRLIQNCLAKDPDERWQTAHDVLLELRSIGEGNQPSITLIKTPSSLRREQFAWILVAALLLFAGYLLWRNKTEVRNPFVVRVSILSPVGFVLYDEIAVSPDGRKLVFVTAGSKKTQTPSSDGSRQLWLRDLDILEPRMLPGTEGAVFPFWSPDNKHIGFFSQAKLKTMDTTGGTPQILCDALQGRGATWSKKDEILFVPFTAAPLYVISAKGGTPRQVTKIQSNRESGHRFPHFLPDSEHFLYVSDANPRSVWVGSLKGDTQKLIDPGPSEAIYAAGKLFFIQNGILYAQPFDQKTLRLSGDQEKIAQQISWNNPFAFGGFSVSSEGVVAYRTAIDQRTQLVWHDRTGTKLASVGEPGSDSEPVISGNGERFAFFRNDLRTGSRDVWLGDVKSNTVSRFTFEISTDRAPVWAPDDQSMIYLTASSDKHMFHLTQRNIDGSRKNEMQRDIPALSGPNDWSTDGKFLSIVLNTPQRRADIYILDIATPQKSIEFANTQFNETYAQFSPDVRYIAYTSDESGQDEVYVQPFPQTGAKWQVSSDSGQDPQWRQDGKELFYIGDGQLMAVPIEPTPVFHAGNPKPLFPVNVAPHEFRSSYAATSDGKRFLVTSLSSKDESNAITLLMNR